jgi:DNA-binding protein HU-beta
MTKSQLIAIVAKKSHLTKKAASEAVDTVFDEISRVLTKKKGEKVVISGFGTFYVSKVDDKHVEPFGNKNKRTLVKGHNVVNFRAGKPLRREVW